MGEPASDYAKIDRAVNALIRQPSTSNDPTTRAYLVARAALLTIGNERGWATASEKAYALADEFATHERGLSNGR